MKKRILGLIASAVVLMTSAATMADVGFTTNRSSMFESPSRQSERVELVPRGERIFIHTCLSRREWCDVSWRGTRAWMDANGLMVRRFGRTVRALDVDWPR